MIYEDIEQGTEAWLEIRRGKVTASKMKDVMAKGRGKEPSKTRQKYMTQLLVERLTGQSEDFYVNAAMEWGTEHEPQARLVYEFLHDVEVKQIAFADHPTVEMFGASPDGLIGDDGGLEIKCPLSSTHIEWMLADEVPVEHVKQMMTCMAVTGRKWWDFMSYDPRMPQHLQTFVKRLDRDEQMVVKIEDATQKFNAELSERIEQLNQLAF